MDPRKLSPQQLETIKSHARSFGWEFHINTIPIADGEGDYHASHPEWNQTYVEWYRLRLPNPEHSVNHDITFEPYSK